MAAYQAEAYLERAIESVLAQSLTELELVLVDDGSSDGTAGIIERMRRSDPRIVDVKHERNLGLAAALNSGIARARAPLIARQDADDLSRPGRLAAQAALLQAEPWISICFSSVRYIGPGGESLRELALTTDELELRWQLLFQNPIRHSSAMWRRASIAEPAYDPEFAVAQDYDLWARTARSGRLAAIAEPLVDVRLHDEAVTSARREAQLAASLEIQIREIGLVTLCPRDRCERVLALLQGRLPACGADELGEAFGDYLTLWRRIVAESRRVTRRGVDALDRHLAFTARSIGLELLGRGSRRSALVPLQLAGSASTLSGLLRYYSGSPSRMLARFRR